MACHHIFKWQNLGELCKIVDILPFESFNNKKEWYWLLIKSFFSRRSYREAWSISKKLEQLINQLLANVSFPVHIRVVFCSILPASHT